MNRGVPPCPGATARRRQLPIAAVLGLLLATAGQLWAAEFPFNGGFDLGNGEPLGWLVAGAWEVKPQAACHGKAGIWLLGPAARAGDQLLSAGYLLADRGESLELRLSYTSTGGPLQVGLVPCDRLGARKGTPLLEELPPSDSWTEVEKTLTLPVDAWPAEAAAVRLLVGVDRDGTAVRIDDLKLVPVRKRNLTAIPAVPKLDALKGSNLLPGIDPKNTAAGGTGGWYALDWQGYTARNAELRPGATRGSYGFALTGGETAAGWVSRRVVLDGSMPYTVRATVDGSHLESGQVLLLGRILNPADGTAIWLQTNARLAGCKSSESLSLSLPRLYPVPGTVLAQVAIVLETGAAGTLTVPSLSLKPEPVSLAVRAGRAKPGPENVSLFVSAINNTGSVLKPQAVLTTLDLTGRTIHQEKRAVVMGPHSAAYFPYRPKLPAAGDFRMTAALATKTGELGSTSFSFHVKQEEALGGMTPCGDLQTSNGYLLVNPEDHVKLSLLYAGNRGGNAAALLLCDAFGRSLDKEAVLTIPEGKGTAWQRYEEEFSLGDFIAAQGVVGAVRLLSRRPDESGAEDLDALLAANETQEPQPSSARPPDIILAQRPNLLPSTAGTPEGAERIGAWAPLAAPGLAPEQATALKDPDSGQFHFKLLGGEKPAAWATSALPLDGALPYAFTVTVDTGNLDPGSGLMLLRLLDPRDQAVVLWQDSVVLKQSATPQTVTLGLPRVAAKSALALAQVVVAINAGSGGCLSFTAPALRPELLSVSVRPGIQGAGSIDPLAPQVFVSAVNNGETDLRPTAYLSARDANGGLGYEEKRAIVIGARSAAHFPFKLRLPAAGEYVIEVRVESEGKELGRGSLTLTAGG